LLRSAAQAVLEWWRSRFRFSDDDGTPHEVYFQGTEESNQLMVASTPVAIDTFLDDAQTRTNAMTDPTEKQRRNDAISVARDTLAELDRVTYRRSGRPPAGVTIEERVVSGLLRRLADKLRILMRDTSDRPVPRILVVPGFSATKASQLEVRYLFNGPGNHDDGTPASTYGGDLSGALPILVSLGVRTDWVAFHILNENTGGLAVDSNLIPAPRDTNTEYLDEFEEPHLKHEHDNGSVVWMEARFDYRTSEGFPEFIRTYTARGGIMRWVSGSSLWERNPSADFPTFRRTMDLPRASAILINLLPLSTSPADERIRSLATRGTAMTANTLELITRWRRAHGAPIVWNKDYLIRYYSWAVEEFDPARTSGRRTNDQFGIDNADIDYRPR
jgi:hypothetical protein